MKQDYNAIRGESLDLCQDWSFFCFLSSFCGIKVIFGFEVFAFGHHSSQSLIEWTALRQTIKC